MLAQFRQQRSQFGVRSYSHVVVVVQRQNLLDELPDGVPQLQRVVTVPVTYRRHRHTDTRTQSDAIQHHVRVEIIEKNKLRQKTDWHKKSEIQPEFAKAC